MYIDGDRLIISIDSDLNEVNELGEFVKSRMEYIEGVDFEQDKPSHFGSSALFALLAAMKTTKPELDIPLFAAGGFDMAEMGVLYWEAAWIKNN
ncbi:hypothetical protein FACS1894103_1020 [Campylobacterota bacterium]|nr:hypothetical protein FACS1894103_1020 [Campylobacterota bacterium]